MKWDKLLKKLYAACLNHDRTEEMRLYFKALKKNAKSHLKNKKSNGMKILLHAMYHPKIQYGHGCHCFNNCKSTVYGKNSSVMHDCVNLLQMAA